MKMLKANCAQVMVIIPIGTNMAFMITVVVDALRRVKQSCVLQQVLLRKSSCSNLIKWKFKLPFFRISR